LFDKDKKLLKIYAYSIPFDPNLPISFIKTVKSYKNVEKSIPKVCFVDTGLYLDNYELSRAMENIVYIELRKKYGENIYYYVTPSGKEIDFLVKVNDRRLLIEVTSEPDKEHIKKALEAMSELKIKKSLIITWNHEGEEKIKKKEIKFIPLWKWLIKGN